MDTPTLTFGQVTVYLGDKNGKYPDGNQVVVRGSDTKVIFDTPLVANHLKHALEGTELVILGHVHEDHCAGLHLLPEAKVVVHEADADAIRSLQGLLDHYGLPPGPAEKMAQFVTDEFFFQPRPDAEGFKSESTWDVGGSRITALHTPGHTGGHSALFIEPEGVVFIGDIDLTGFGPYYGDGCSNLQDFRDSMDRLENLEAKVWVTSHHRGVITEREIFLDMLRIFRSKIDEREAAIVDEIRKEPRSLQNLVEHRFVYPNWYDGIWVESCETITIAQHLEELVAAGSVIEEEGVYRIGK